jgi:hypothetical protein
MLPDELDSKLNLDADGGRGSAPPTAPGAAAGAAGGPQQQQQSAQLSSLWGNAQVGGVVVVWPKGLAGGWLAEGWRVLCSAGFPPPAPTHMVIMC